MNVSSRIRTIVLIVVLIAIAGAIWYLESGKAGPGGATASSTPIANTSSAKAALYPKAQEFVEPTAFINSQPFTLQSLVGKKVVLIDFWTYSCINCIRTLPYLKAWYAKYKDAGLEIVGVHSPEFAFEKVEANVQAAVQKFGIQYPVVMDNDYGTWSAYKNQYWPHEYLIDIDGYVVHDQIGEGGYADTERAIQNALAERKSDLKESGAIPTGIVDPSDVETVETNHPESQETYFGSARNEFFGNGERSTANEQTLSVPQTTNTGSFYLGGTWDFSAEYAENKTAHAEIVYPYQAQRVFFVASAKSPVKVQVLIDGKAPGTLSGADVDKDGFVTIKENRLYDLIDDSAWGSHTIRLIIQSPGLDAYTFTFG
jgi:thiol-disulfide isomerase/thioredoxin